MTPVASHEDRADECTSLKLNDGRELLRRSQDRLNRQIASRRLSERPSPADVTGDMARCRGSRRMAPMERGGCRAAREAAREIPPSVPEIREQHQDDDDPDDALIEPRDERQEQLQDEHDQHDSEHQFNRAHETTAGLALRESGFVRLLTRLTF